jgi:hypothetical protein
MSIGITTIQAKRTQSQDGYASRCPVARQLEHLRCTKTPPRVSEAAMVDCIVA